MTERIILKGNDVISMEEHRNITFQATSKVSEIRNELDRFLKNEEHRKWFKSGIGCEVFLGNGTRTWTKGKVKFVLEFIPEEKPIPRKKEQPQHELPPEETPSPLDDLRKQLNS